MRILLIVAIMALSIGLNSAAAADRDKSLAQIETAKNAIEQLKTKIGDNKIITPELDSATKYLEKALISLKEGEKIFGGVSDEAEQEIRHQTSMVDLSLKLAASKLERSKIEPELAEITRKTSAVKARVKIFDDFKSEITRLKKELADNDKAAKELAALIAEKDNLAAQLDKLKVEKGLLEKIKEENDSLKKSMSRLKSENDNLTRQSDETVPEKLPIQVKPKDIINAPVTKPVESPLPVPGPQPVVDSMPDQPKQPSDKSE
jgi:Rad3-related DNA helicase